MQLAYPILNEGMAGQIVPGQWHGVDPFDYMGPAMGSSYVPSDLCPPCGATRYSSLTLVSLRSSAGCGAAGLRLPRLSATASSAPGVLASPQMLLGKRRRGADDALDNEYPEVNNDHGPCPGKKSKREMVPTIGVLEAGRPTTRTRHKPAARTPESNGNKSMAVGRGAERLATPNARGVYHRFLQGPSVQQESLGTTAQEQPLWAEGSVQGVTWHHMGGVVRQEEKEGHKDGRPEEPESKFFRISKRLNKRHRALLEATSADWARGAIRVLKCRLCPSAGFGNWNDFKRHCDSMEAHPLKISFCDHCGDFFARRDSLERHCKNRPPQCLDVSLEKAEAKRRKTESAHEEFQARLESCLMTGGEIGMPFSQIVKKMYPISSKRGSRQQSRLQS